MLTFNKYSQAIEFLKENKDEDIRIVFQNWSSESKIQDFIKAIENNTQTRIKEVHIRVPPIVSEISASLQKTLFQAMINNWDSIEVLEIETQEHFPSEEAKALLIEMLKCNPNIRTLRIDSAYLNSEVIQSVIKLPQLKGIYLTRGGLMPELFVELIAACTNLKSLGWDDSRFFLFPEHRDEGISIFKILAEHPHLEKLNLRWCTLEPKIMEDLLEMIKDKGNFKTLYLPSFAMLNDGLVRLLAETLQANPNLKRLSLNMPNSSSISTETIEYLGNALVRLPYLEAIEIKIDGRVQGNLFEKIISESFSIKEVNFAITQSHIGSFEFEASIKIKELRLLIQERGMTDEEIASECDKLATPEIYEAYGHYGPTAKEEMVNNLISFFQLSTDSQEHKEFLSKLEENKCYLKTVEMLKRAAIKNTSITHFQLSGLYAEDMSYFDEISERNCTLISRNSILTPLALRQAFLSDNERFAHLEWDTRTQKAQESLEKACEAALKLDAKNDDSNSDPIFQELRFEVFIAVLKNQLQEEELQLEQDFRKRSIENKEDVAELKKQSQIPIQNIFETNEAFFAALPLCVAIKKNGEKTLIRFIENSYQKYFDSALTRAVGEKTLAELSIQERFDYFLKALKIQIRNSIEGKGFDESEGYDSRFHKATQNPYKKLKKVVDENNTTLKELKSEIEALLENQKEENWLDYVAIGENLERQMQQEVKGYQTM